MKNNSIKILIAVLAVVVVGGGVYFANTKQQQGSLTALRPIALRPQNTIENCNGTTIYDSSNSANENFRTNYYKLLDALQRDTSCAYAFAAKNADNDDLTFTCGKSEIRIQDYRIYCKKDPLTLILTSDINQQLAVGSITANGKVAMRQYYNNVKVNKVSTGFGVLSF